MSLTDLLKEAQKLKNEIEADLEQEKLTATAELDAKLAIEQAKFEVLLKKDAGDIFDRLDELPTIEAGLNSSTVLQAKVLQRVVSVRISEAYKNGSNYEQWSVFDQLSNTYWDERGGQFSDKNAQIEFGKLSDYLLIRFLEIAEENDRLLVQLEKKKGKA